MLKPQDVVNEFSSALVEGRGAIFVGSGISISSGLPSWADLLRELAKTRLRLRLELKDDLPLIAQHIVNKTNNRALLVNHFRDMLQKKYALSPYHASLAMTNVKCLWTTNYDTLLESAFGTHFDVTVRASDESISSGGRVSDIEVIKMHGCIGKSDGNDLVITQEDYDDFFVNRPATAHRLRQDLIDRQFLFIGYSYADSNIRNIVVEARRLGGNTLGQHYIILQRIKGDCAAEVAAKQLRQDLWLEELSRVGIAACQIDDFSELQNILEEIALRSRGQTVFVTGTHNRDKSSEEHFKTVGKLLAQKERVVLLDGQSSGVGEGVRSAFMETCLSKRIDILPRLRLFSNPYAANPQFSDNEDLLPALKEWRAPLMRSAQVIVVYDGGMGTKAEVELAKDFGCRILPVPRTEHDLPSRLLAEPKVSAILEKFDPDYLERARSYAVSPEDVAACVMKMVEK